MERLGNLTSCSPPSQITHHLVSVGQQSTSDAKKECDFCATNRKVVYLCRCGKKCCMKDLMGHKCAYDYKQSGKKELEEKNPKLKDSKGYQGW